MIILPLHCLYVKDDSESLKKRKRIAEIAILDSSVKLAFEITSIDCLWEYDLELIQGMNYGYNTRVYEDFSVFESKGVKTVQRGLKPDSDLVRNYLTLPPLELSLLSQLESTFSTYFLSLIRLIPGEKPQEFMPCRDFDDPLARKLDRAYLICNINKEDKERIKIEEYYNNILLLEFLYVCVDPISTTHLDELIEIIPDISKFPEYIQKKIERIPSRYKNIPERLECLIGAYKKYWSDFKEDKGGSELRKVLNDKSIEYMKSEFNKKARLYNDHRNDQNQIIFGYKLAQCAAKIIEPDFLKGRLGHVKKQISNGVPSKLWVLICLARYFWKNVDKDDLEKHPKGKHIENVLKRFGETKPFENDPIPRKVLVDLTPLSDSYDDYRKFMNEFSEIKYMRGVSFSSDYKYAASIIRPLWANSKSKGGSKYGKKKSKGRENYILLEVGKASDIDNE